MNCWISTAQDYRILNKNEEISISIDSDSIIIIIKNKSDKTIFLPKMNLLNQSKSNDNSILYLEYGIDLQVFNERGIFELEILNTNETKTIKEKLLVSDFVKVYFSFEYYIRKYKVKNNIRIYNTDFLKDKDWLIKGDWEWGEILIDTRKTIK